MKREAKVPVNETSITKAAVRLLGQRLVTPESAYVRSKLSATATQTELDESILAVRKLPWAKIAKYD